MNATLKPVTNLVVCGVWIVLIVLSLAAHARLEIGIASGALGVIAGFLQARALRANADRFRETGSMWSVRKVMTLSVGGKVSIALVWVNALMVLVWGFKVMSPGSILLGYAAFNLVRDLVTLPAVFWLGRAADSSQAS